jgi:hypothetical protein
MAYRHCVEHSQEMFDRLKLTKEGSTSDLGVWLNSPKGGGQNAMLNIDIHRPEEGVRPDGSARSVR